MSDTKTPGIRVIWVVQKVFEVEYSLQEVKDLLEGAGYNREDFPDEKELRDALDCALGDDMDTVLGDNGPAAEDYKPFLATNSLKPEQFKGDDEEQTDGG